MPRCIVTRTLPPLSPEDLDQVGKRVVDTAAADVHQIGQEIGPSQFGGA